MKVGPAVNKAVANVLALCIALFVAFSGYASTTAHADTVTTPFATVDLKLIKADEQ